MHLGTLPLPALQGGHRDRRQRLVLQPEAQRRLQCRQQVLQYSKILCQQLCLEMQTLQPEAQRRQQIFKLNTIQTLPRV